MNPTQIQCFLFLLVLAVIGFGPISITCLIGFHIVINRPPWFLDLVRKLYHGKPGVSTAPARGEPPARSESKAS